MNCIRRLTTYISVSSLPARCSEGEIPAAATVATEAAKTVTNTKKWFIFSLLLRVDRSARDWKPHLGRLGGRRAGRARTRTRINSDHPRPDPRDGQEPTTDMTLEA